MDNLGSLRQNALAYFVRSISDKGKNYTIDPGGFVISAKQTAKPALPGVNFTQFLRP
jgi:hypothetical protein